jgi:hypothetical protein
VHLTTLDPNTILGGFSLAIRSQSPTFQRLCHCIVLETKIASIFRGLAHLSTNTFGTGDALFAQQI